MEMAQRTKGVKTKADFLASFYSTFGMTEAASRDVGVNQYFFDESTGELSINSGGGKPLYFRFYFEGLQRGDVLSVSWESINESCANGVSVMTQETPSRGGSGIQVVLTHFQKGLGAGREYFEASYPQYEHTHPNVYVCVGMTTAGSGVIRLKNVNAKVVTHRGQPASQKKLDVKIGEILKSSAGFSPRSDFAGAGQFAVSEFDANTIQVTYQTAFQTGSLRPVVMAGQESFSQSHKYIARTSDSQLTGFKVSFYDSTTGAVVALASLSNDIFVGWNAVTQIYDE